MDIMGCLRFPCWVAADSPPVIECRMNLPKNGSSTQSKLWDLPLTTANKISSSQYVPVCLRWENDKLGPTWKGEKVWWQTV